MLPNKHRQEIDDRLVRISKLLNDTYKNKSSEEYKMRGDITKSAYYSNIEKCIADLSTLRGFSKSDASDLSQMFNTLHRPFFKNMVREYMTEPNEKNTVFCALFTLGFRLLVGELSRIYTSVEATPKGLEYKPDKVSRRNDVSKIISIFKGDLEAKINAEIHATSKASTKIEESYLEDMIAQMYVEEYLDETFGDTIYNEAAKIDKEIARQEVGKLIRDPKIAHVRLDNVDDASDDEDGVSPVKEGEISTATDPSYGTTDTDVDASDSGNSVNDESYQEGVVDSMEKMSGRISDVADKIGPKISNIAAWAAPVAAGLSIFAGLFRKITGFLSGKNPIAELNFYFTNKYEKIINKFNVVSANYFATKEAYDEYLKIPEAQRKKKVESKYLQNMEKYNIQMKNLNAQIEHFNSRAKADTSSPAPKPAPAPKQPDTSGDTGNQKPKTDDDFDF